MMAKETEDRTAWDNDWASMPHRRLENPPKIDVADSSLSDCGEVVSSTISEVPPQYSDKVWRQSETCPLCGATTDEARRLPAMLYPTFANGLTFCMGVWVHESCFQSCPNAEEPAPIPW